MQTLELQIRCVFLSFFDSARKQLAHVCLVNFVRNKN
jgi:hypothetical protein